MTIDKFESCKREIVSEKGSWQHLILKFDFLESVAAGVKELVEASGVLLVIEP